ncbi:MAG: hypothetical protein ACRER4_09065 [Steroidobacteraceae bacterium]
MTRRLESVGTIARRAAPKKPTRYEQLCRCGHAKQLHELHPAIVDLGIPSGTTCLSCGCPVYRAGSKRKQ